MASKARGASVAASFRDPSGYVFEREGRIYRAVSREFYQIWDQLRQAGLIGEWERDGKLVTTRTVEEPLNARLAGEHPGFTVFLEHQRIANITYPYEWSVSMLADAALLTLELQLALLERGYALKDASAYNIQFVRGRPVFIDVTSLERPQRLDVWFALGQFQRMFLFPLLLCRYRGWDLRSYFLSNLDGLSPERLRRNFPGLAGWCPRLLLDLTLPLLLERRDYRRAEPRQGSAAVRQGTGEAQRLNLKRLRRKIAGLVRDFTPRSEWTEYTETCSYDEAGQAAKKRWVGEFLESTRPARVLDLGCNTGDYSLLAAFRGAEVMAADGDPNVIDRLYRRVKEKPVAVSPVVLDIANPSPAIGFRNEERPRFLDRADADCLLALALLHHLLVSANLSLGQIAGLLADLTRQYAVVEFVPLQDPMFQRLLRFRVNLFEDLSLETCRAAFGRHFAILKESAVPGSMRTLLFLRKQ